jgi:hypothetical protein
MRTNSASSTGEGQPSLDLTDCSFAPIPGTAIDFVIPSPEAELRLTVQLGVPDRFKAIRTEALRNLAPGAGAFAQRNYAIGQHLYLSVSLLTTHSRRRGGWILYFCAAGEETNLIAYIHAARNAVVADLRKEWLKRGSKN